ncbi:XRE family transcriptional regulator [Eubacterium aggregans]|uniref:XRE family transcriptional regulator n=1 Tax=Eubacterium aggregans TaxID=81409 RepID=UPI003F3DAD4E
MHEEYQIRLYDQPLLSFSLEIRGLEGLVATIIEIGPERHLLPLDLEVTNDGVKAWLERRIIPKNRAFVENILDLMGLSISDTKGIIDICKGLSLNDSFWVVPIEFEGKFEDYNLYENPFSDVLALVAYTGDGYGDPIVTTSPEFTTGGALPKAWRHLKDDGISLYKGGTSGGANTGNEPFSEFYASQIAKRMGLNHVFYDLENWKGILASKCALFTDIDTAYMPIGHIVKSGGLKACLDYYETLGANFSEQIKSMLVFDALIYNEDRHFGNFGVLVDSHTMKIQAPAPIFDNGYSLFNYAMPYEWESLEALEKYVATRRPAYVGLTFDGICKEIIGKTQTKELRRMIGFEFERHPSINQPEKRLIILEKHLQKRARHLLSLATEPYHRKDAKEHSGNLVDDEWNEEI